MAMGEKDIRIGDAIISYRAEEDGIVLTGARRANGILEIPDVIDGKPVIGIAKKAFVGLTGLRQVILPASCRYVEEWGFAQCTGLELFTAHNSRLQLGKGVFNLCENLQNICIGTEEKNDLSILLATLACRMEAEYLLTDEGRGSREWYDKWDKKLAGFLAESDEDGYMKLALCGEEDIMLNMSQFMEKKRKEKCDLCLIRLKHRSHLSQEMRDCFVSYLKNLTKGQPTEEAWLALFEDFDGDVSYYEVFAKVGCVTADNLDAILLDMGQEFAQAKAFLLKYKEAHFEKVDVFAQFAL